MCPSKGTIQLSRLNPPSCRTLASDISNLRSILLELDAILLLKMASEARAMLDALMGSDRDSSIPVGASTSKVDGEIWPGSRGNKKSCYDGDICPLYCAWGIDVYDLFTNTKSDLGQNPYITQEDAREEFLSLPDHEKDRLGYEHILYRKLGDLVRGCDRIVARNKDKLRAEVAKAARARGADGNRIDPVTEVKEEVILETAECMADLELREEEVAQMVEKLVKLDKKWKELWKQLKILRGEKNDDNENPSILNYVDQFLKVETDTSTNGKVEKNKEEKEHTNELDEDATSEKLCSNEDPHGNADETEVAKSEQENDVSKMEQTNTKDGNDGCSATSQTVVEEKQTEELSILDSKKIEELKLKLYGISSEQQKLISSLTSITSQNIMPLRENLQGLQKQLYYIRYVLKHIW